MSSIWGLFVVIKSTLHSPKEQKNLQTFENVYVNDQALLNSN